MVAAALVMSYQLNLNRSISTAAVATVIIQYTYAAPKRHKDVTSAALARYKGSWVSSAFA